MPDHVVAFPEKLKTIATRCAIFSLKFTKNRLAARGCFGLKSEGTDSGGEQVTFWRRDETQRGSD